MSIYLHQKSGAGCLINMILCKKEKLIIKEQGKYEEK